MSILMMFEMTLDYQIILPLMMACIMAYYVSLGMRTAGGRSTASHCGARTGAKPRRSPTGSTRG